MASLTNRGNVEVGDQAHTTIAVDQEAAHLVDMSGGSKWDWDGFVTPDDVGTVVRTTLSDVSMTMPGGRTVTVNRKLVVPARQA